MDKRAINNFAVNARRDLIRDISLKLERLGISEKGVIDKLPTSTGSAEFYPDFQDVLVGENIEYRRKIVSAITEMSVNSSWIESWQEFVEQVAYTWFNRIVAIRFMEVNDYLPSGVRVLSSVEGRNEPDIMSQAKAVEESLGGYSASERELIDRAWGSQQPADMDRLYQMLFTKQVNELTAILPQLFVTTDEYLQLLFAPSYQSGVIKALVADVPEADFDINAEGQVEIIGWLYQYYNQEPKDKAFKKSKYATSDIPAVTQLFTPDWIVKYLVENSLGRYWIDHLHAAGDRRSAAERADAFVWRYFMADATQNDEVQVQIDKTNSSLADLKPENIRFIDPASGSGHILVYAFDVFMQLYLAEGYTQRQAAVSILTNNLFGFDVDTRAFQLTYFALMMKGRQYNRRILTQNVAVHVFDVPEFSWSEEDIATLTSDPKLITQLKAISSQFSHGNELGSLISLKDQGLDFDQLAALTEREDGGQIDIDEMHRETIRTQLSEALAVLQILDGDIDIAVTNPPYMGSGKMPKSLGDFVKKHYPNSKADLFAVFMERLRELTKPEGYYAMITQHQWMFLSSFEKLRGLLKAQTIVNLAHLGTRAFEEIGGEVVQSVAFVFRNQTLLDFEGRYERLVDFDSQQKKEQAYLEAVENPGISYVYRSNQANFEVIVEQPITYWFSERMVSAFRDFPALQEVAELKAGLSTGDNGIFQRRWQEVKDTNISFTTSTISETTSGDVRWYPCDTGGLFIKWSNRKEIVVDWQNNGEHIRNYTNRTGRMAGAARNTSYYFRPGISWNKLSSSRFGARYRTSGYVFDDTSRTMYPDASVSAKTILGFINSKVAFHFLQGLNPSMSFTNGDLKRLPVSVKSDNAIDTIVGTCIAAVEEGIDSYEESWQFTQFPFLKIAEHHRNWTVEAAFDAWRDEAQQRFDQLKANEEELNRIFIDLYGLQDELTPEVKDEDVSVRLADRGRDIRSFLSYFIGVTFGRYSIDTAGLAYAGGYWDSSKYKTVQPVEDDVVLLTDDDYFGDERDILVRFKKFMTTTFGVEHLSENIRYIADSLNTKGDTPEDQIRHYFCDDFFRDHLSTYQKRPIYWQLNAGKQGGFKALLYLHRYDENTMATIRTAYLHPLQDAYAQKQEYLSHLLETEKSSSERNSIGKRLTKLANQLDEITKFDQSLQHVANLHIDLDLDDGVVVNYEKVQGGEKLLTPLK
ncbi:BREX-1 system adenine-specific DNA-methyltransferase PglX [Lacticaseibacillus mingshuiensis]|uniref:BREX-1 system adenine-specific DNA-methyltransferase PglX n=1 Tax=Lacticaseibacillus mingshuiensis TaxID=2799574 RepID=UPI00194DC9A5|nr:BREX-1 system adenine-specific DNA-methyltransferase PglX [Lacticaseibacillus mingshuiensis]